VFADLKRLASWRGFSGYQPLRRAYVGKRLRMDLVCLEIDTVAASVESLKRHGVSAKGINEALGDTPYW
jgi:hypothetical protein